MDEWITSDSPEAEQNKYMEIDSNRSRIEFVEDLFEDVRSDFNEDDPVDISLYIDADDNPHINAKRLALVKWVCLFLLFWTAHFYLSDNAVDLMLKFLHALFSVMGCYSPWFGPVVILFPTLIYLLRNTLGLCEDKFTKFLVCPHCRSLYTFPDCFVTLSSLPKEMFQ